MRTARGLPARPGSKILRESSVQRLAGIILVGAAAAVLSTGCALRDPRADYYAYSRASDGLWGDTQFDLIDWNFPTSLNQPPIEAPKRIRLERTAIGVSWATRNPLPLWDNLAPYDVPVTPAAKADDAAKATPSSDVARTSAAGVNAADRERRGVR
jgi:hypothetical protein